MCLSSDSHWVGVAAAAVGYGGVVLRPMESGFQEDYGYLCFVVHVAREVGECWQLQALPAPMQPVRLGCPIPSCTEFISRQRVSGAENLPQAPCLPTEEASRAFRFHASLPATASVLVSALLVCPLPRFCPGDFVFGGNCYKVQLEISFSLWSFSNFTGSPPQGYLRDRVRNDFPGDGEFPQGPSCCFPYPCI